ncbi:hypothetical protein Poli38472_005210 [Pythium oligandrum]|uniref:Uncharacterized protein n=1 Tax=Pythium oligandrum TaxID=41045 RepID=A0A8K1CI77_PYTOL|nr:hypothetical protein Poli38472_005210 [Pythium oligandrum]|eukprot:TMW62592.1 hypothetical protein Poli38472_005210 [Pythium oligandrum]
MELLRELKRRRVNAGAVDANTTRNASSSGARAVSNAESPMLRLSPSILREQVFSFLLFQPLMPHGIDLRVFDAQSSQLRLVCRQWRDVVVEMRRFEQPRALMLDIKTHETRLHDRITTDMEQLEIVMGVMQHAPEHAGGSRRRTEYQPYFTQYRKVEEMQIEWKAVLSGASQLRRLDLSLTATSQVSAILREASSACPQLTALLLPLGEIEPTKRVPFFKDLYTALECWFQTNGGLLQLRVPWIPSDERESFLEAVTSFCPNIQYLQTYSSVRRRFMDDWPIGQSFFNVPIKTWRAFCGQCVNLRELDWSMTPWSEEFIREFTVRKWSKLTELRIRFNASTGRLLFMRKELGKVFDAVPALRVLELNLPARPGSDTGAAFGCDNVLLDLASRCPALEMIHVRPSQESSRAAGMKPPFFSDHSDPGNPTSKGRDALLGMPRLAYIRIGKLVDDDASSLTNALRLSPLRTFRRVDFRAIGPVHGAIASMLHYLKELDSDRLENLNLSLQLEQSSFDGSSILRTRDVEGVLARIRAKHPKTVKRLHLRASKFFDRDGRESAVFYGCEVWINHVEAGRVDDCKVECNYEGYYSKKRSGGFLE